MYRFKRSGRLLDGGVFEQLWVTHLEVAWLHITCFVVRVQLHLGFGILALAFSEASHLGVLCLLRGEAVGVRS